MTKQVVIPVVLLPCLITALCFAGLFARDEAPSTWKSLEFRYAQADLELANARLALAESQNALTAGTISPDMIEMLKAGVKLTQDRLKQLQTNDNANPYAPQIAAATDELNALVYNHNKSLQANQLQAGAVPAPQLRREQAEIDVASVHLAELKALSQQSFEVRIGWEIRQLQDEVRALLARPQVRS